MSLSAHLITLAIAAVVASPQSASTRRTITETYRVTYKADRDVYCIRAFADPSPANPHPGTPPDPCRTRADWAKDGVQITDPQRAIAPS
jgi:hypothetical protein